MRSSSKLVNDGVVRRPRMAGAHYRFGPTGGPEDDEQGPGPRRPVPTEREDLSYRVELWDEARASVEQVLAVTANGSIGYAAYYAATREFPHRYITLRHKSRIVSRWNAPRH